MTFYSWLKLQSDRDDRVGDLSRDAAWDRTYNTHLPTSPRGWLKRLNKMDACPAAVESCKRAIKEYGGVV